MKQRKAALLDRIQRAEGAVGRMPPAGNLTAADLQTLVTYLQSL